jgi:hypothetical protein
MSYRRIFSLRELALCLVILANAIGLGAVILTTAVSASSTLEKAAAEANAETPTLAVERVDQGKVGTDDVHAAVDTTTEIIESLPELSSDKAAVSEQISVQVVEAPATTVVPVTEDSSNNGPLLNPAGDSSVEVPDVEPAAHEDTSPHAIPLDDYSSENSSESDAAPTVNVVEPRTLEIAKAMLNADLEELMDSGLDFSSAIEEIDLMAEEERYGEFGKR